MERWKKLDSKTPHCRDSTSRYLTGLHPALRVASLFQVKAKLPPLLHAVKKAGINCIWQCDPMHGNTSDRGREQLSGRGVLALRAKRFAGRLVQWDQVSSVRSVPAALSFEVQDQGRERGVQDA